MSVDVREAELDAKSVEVGLAFEYHLKGLGKYPVALLSLFTSWKENLIITFKWKNAYAQVYINLHSSKYTCTCYIELNMCCAYCFSAHEGTCVFWMYIKSTYSAYYAFSLQTFPITVLEIRIIKAATTEHCNVWNVFMCCTKENRYRSVRINATDMPR